MQEKIIWPGALTASIVILVYSFWTTFSFTEQHSGFVSYDQLAIQNLDQSISIEILNGCGIPNLAARLTKKARHLGIDVIHEGNANNFNYLHTMVIHRGGPLDHAKEVAKVLSIPNVIQQQITNTFRLTDVTVIIGRDFQRIGLFAEELQEITGFYETP